MKIAYMGPLPEVHVSGVGKCKRGSPVEAAKDIAKILLARKDWVEVKSTTFRKSIVEKGGKKSGGKK